MADDVDSVVEEPDTKAWLDCVCLELYEANCPKRKLSVKYLDELGSFLVGVGDETHGMSCEQALHLANFIQSLVAEVYEEEE